jgi:hypothetical protein
MDYLFYMDVELDFHTKGRSQIASIWEKDTEVNVRI